uniref:Putative secreted protein n=1 Tax=Anopheles darlingi TaxID=43151 RepID=A0A2M4D8W4_ANODA
MPIARAMMEGLSLHSLAISCFAHAQRPRRGFTVPRLPKKNHGRVKMACDAIHRRVVRRAKVPILSEFSLANNQRAPPWCACVRVA